MKKLVLFTILGLWLNCIFPSAALAKQPKLIFEELVIATKAIMTINVGKSDRIVQISASGNQMNIHFEIKVDVSAMFLSYHRKSEVDAWYDRNGLLMFISEINEDGKVTVLNGLRRTVVGEKVVMQINGVINGEAIRKEYPFSMIHFTNLENFAFAAAMTRTKTTWRILNLFNGEIELVKSTPEGIEQCPDFDEEYCYRVSIWSKSQQAVFHYSMDGRIAHADGRDDLGKFLLLPTDERKREKKKGISSFFTYNISRDPKPREEEKNLSILF